MIQIVKVTPNLGPIGWLKYFIFGSLKRVIGFEAIAIDDWRDAQNMENGGRMNDWASIKQFRGSN